MISTRLFIMAFVVSSVLGSTGASRAESAGQASTDPGAQVVGTQSPSIELAVEPQLVQTGDITTLKVVYHNLGQPYTEVQFSVPGLVNFDPDLPSPCKWDEHSTRCTEITLRAMAPGIVEISAGATGEALDELCGCWVWTGAASDAPATLVIGDTIWKVRLTTIIREWQ